MHYQCNFIIVSLVKPYNQQPKCVLIDCDQSGADIKSANGVKCSCLCAARTNHYSLIYTHQWRWVLTFWPAYTCFCLRWPPLQKCHAYSVQGHITAWCGESCNAIKTMHMWRLLDTNKKMWDAAWGAENARQDIEGQNNGVRSTGRQTNWATDDWATKAGRLGDTFRSTAMGRQSHNKPITYNCWQDNCTTICIIFCLFATVSVIVSP